LWYLGRLNAQERAIVALLNWHTAHDLRSAQVKGWLRQRLGGSQQDIAHLKGSLTGETLLVLGNGPSLASIPNSLLSRFVTFGSNGIFLKFLPDLYITISREFHKHYKSQIAELEPKIKFLASEMRNEGLSGTSPTMYLPTVFPAQRRTPPYERLTNPVMFSKDPSRVVYLGGTVIFAQLQLAMYMGVRQVLIAGLDHDFGIPSRRIERGAMTLTIDGQDPYHFSPSYLPSGATAHHDPDASNRSFVLALQAYEKARVPLWNVTSRTKLEILPTARLESFVE